MQDYLDYVNRIVDAYNEAARLSPQEATPPAHPAPNAQTVLLCSPHPDDEMLVGALPLRLLRQCGLRVVNLAVTLGSKRDRQLERLAELRRACALTGFEIRTIGQRGLEGIHPEAAEQEPTLWARAVDEVCTVLDEVRPTALFYPHAQDANRTHMGVHRLLRDALHACGRPLHCFQTEFWAPLETPNLLVESSPEDVALLIHALAMHKGEVARNPYHLRLPMWMMDNVRRGAERVGGQGVAAPPFRFATLYRHGHWDGSRWEHTQSRGVFLSCGDNPSLLLASGR